MVNLQYRILHLKYSEVDKKINKFSSFVFYLHQQPAASLLPSVILLNQFFQQKISVLLPSLSVPPVIILACYPTVFDKSAPSCIQVQRPFPQLASQKLRTNGTSYSYSYFYSWGQVFRCSRSYTVIDVHAEFTRQVLFHSKIRPFCVIISIQIQMFSTVTAEAMWGNAGSGGQQCAIMGTIIDNTPVWWSSDVMRL